MTQIRKVVPNNKSLAERAEHMIQQPVPATIRLHPGRSSALSQSLSSESSLILSPATSSAAPSCVPPPVSPVPVIYTIPKLQKTDQQLRVAGYCRVSTLSDSQEASIVNQREHWEEEIKNHQGWTFAGIYWEAGVSGTKAENRPELQRLLADCEAHRIDLVVAKSISRFARNTTDALEMVRRLNSLGVHILFQKENIDTRTMQGELLLTIFASFAAEESHSIQTNTQWAIHKRFEDGTFKYSKAPYGYKLVDGNFVVDPDAAPIVREIFAAVLAGKGACLIAKDLEARGIPTGTKKRNGSPGQWSSHMVNGIVQNITYTGDVLMQKSYSDENYHCCLNYGEREQYYCDHHHVAIIDHDTFNLANEAMRQRGKEKNNIPREDRQLRDNPHTGRTCMSGIVYCGCCGSVMKRITQRIADGKQYHWGCTQHLADKEKCSMKRAGEANIQNAFMTMLNKMYFARDMLFDPLIQALTERDRVLDTITIVEIQHRCDQINEERSRLKMMLSKGCGEPISMRRRLLELDAEEAELKSISQTRSKEAEEVIQLKKHVTEWGEHFNDAFPILLFQEIVEGVTVEEPKRYTFHLKCGIIVTEGAESTAAEPQMEWTGSSTVEPHMEGIPNHPDRL